MMNNTVNFYQWGEQVKLLFQVHLYICSVSILWARGAEQEWYQKTVTAHEEKHLIKTSLSLVFQKMLSCFLISEIEMA